MATPPTAAGTAGAAPVPARVFWPVLAGQILSGCAIALALLMAAGPLAQMVGAGGLVMLLGLSLLPWQWARRRQGESGDDAAAATALLLALRSPAALSNAAGLVEANAAWIALAGRTAPEALGLTTPPPCRDLPLSLKDTEPEAAGWRAEGSRLGFGDLVLWTLGRAESWHPMAQTLEAAGIGWVEVDGQETVTAAGAFPAAAQAIGRPLDDVSRPRAGEAAIKVFPGPANQAGCRLGIVIDANQKAPPGEVETRFRRLFDDAPVGIAVVGPGGGIVDANLAFAHLVAGAAVGDVIGRRFRDFVQGDEVPALDEILAGPEAAAFGAPVEVRFRGGREERAARLYASRQGQGEGGLGEEGLGVLFLLDTTRQKALEHQIAQSQKLQAVGQLAGGIAHDFNNLLTAIIGFSDLLLIRHSAGEQSFADIMQIKQNANRAANLVRQLLAFSRQQTLRPKVLDVTDVLAELSNLLRRLIGENIELRMVHGRDLGPVQVDPGQLDQVIINLAVNARDAMPGGGVLSIRTANVTPADARALGPDILPEGDYVLIEVADTGHGIPVENLGKIFEPFFTTKEVGAGTGLGLSTVYGIVKQTGGFIVPASVQGRGATFSIYLPRHVPTDAAEPVVVPAVERETGRDLTGKGTILLVEDEDAVRTFAARALRNKGYTVLEAASGERALEIVISHNGRIDLLISDVVMPSMDGPTLIKQARRHRYDMKIIFISGYAEEAFRRNLDPRETFSFLPKPFSLKQLASKVKESIGGA